MKTLAALALALSPFLPAAAAEVDPSLVELNQRSYFLGREYFVLRSGRAQAIAQADRADLGPAFTYLVFDAFQARQSARKERAFNYVPGVGFGNSALEVVLGGFPFTALGHRTDTRRVVEEGIPAVEATWWAGGVRVTECIAALGDAGVFRRSIRLEGAHLVGRETVSLRLGLPPGECMEHGPILVRSGKGARLGLAVLGNVATHVDPKKGTLEVGPLEVQPHGRAAVETLLVADIPAGDASRFVARVKAAQSSGAAAEQARTREEWSRVSSIKTTDATVQDLFDKARSGLPGMIASDGTMDAGIFEYGAQWVRDTSNTALGALHAGHFELARASLENVLTKMIRDDGATMISGAYDSPDLEQFDQMGELLHMLRCYRDWTGDDALIRAHRDRLLAVVGRPLSPRFRDETGMVHNRREFWERALDDAYELAYQAYVILGLREAAELAPELGAVDRATRWRAQADRIERAMLGHPTRALVDGGRLVKRRNVTGAIADHLDAYKGFLPDSPGSSEQHHRLLPDASMALPIALGVVDPHSAVAGRTLDHLEELWNTRWSDGGYDRYHTSSQPDQPGPWTFATTFILRAQHDAGRYDLSRRSLEWLNTVQGGRAGAWFEAIPSIRAQQRTSGILPWTSGEIALFVVRHYLGVRFEAGMPVIRPALYPGSPPVSADLRFRQGRLRLEIDGSGPIVDARVDGRRFAVSPDGAVRLAKDFAGGRLVLRTRPSPP
jgi:hypothetical protein